MSVACKKDNCICRLLVPEKALLASLLLNHCSKAFTAREPAADRRNKRHTFCNHLVQPTRLQEAQIFRGELTSAVTTEAAVMDRASHGSCPRHTQYVVTVRAPTPVLTTSYLCNSEHLIPPSEISAETLGIDTTNTTVAIHQTE